MAEHDPDNTQYPESWYAVTPSTTLRRGDVHALDAFGQSLVLFRTLQGVAHVSGRFCPHQGASLAAGCVRGENLVCAFHGWEFDPHGDCVSIPFLENRRIPARARIPVFPVIERHGLIWIYNAATPAFPLFAVPEQHGRVHDRRYRSLQLDSDSRSILEAGCIAPAGGHAGPQHFVRHGVEVHTRILGETVGVITIAAAEQVIARLILAVLPLGPRRTLTHVLLLCGRAPLQLRTIGPLYMAWLTRQLVASVAAGQRSCSEPEVQTESP